MTALRSTERGSRLLRVVFLRVAVGAALGALFIAAPAAARLTLDEAPADVPIGVRFDGVSVTVSGRVAPPDGAQAGAAALGPGEGLAIALIGENRPTVLRKKGERYGMWLNVESARLDQAPIYHGRALAALEPDAAPFSLAEVVGPGAQDYREAVIRLRSASGLYAGDAAPLRVGADGRFEAVFRLPSNALEGAYAIEASLLRSGEAVAVDQSGFNLRKVGWERRIHVASKETPLIYAILTLIAAIAAGWLAHAVVGWLRHSETEAAPPAE